MTAIYFFGKVVDMKTMSVNNVNAPFKTKYLGGNVRH